ncbi:sensor histidine kinase [Microaceticoccus formicicus]|uniref:sensor histidine kinase n=1 Tax=Microaceticoccus formicicus TaxID=3118105 RepID=UPI003CD027CE|nr:HAMP domain-containing sensor histidine kinase [Peptoniphilaceae bacterium AMB_02]
MIYFTIASVIALIIVSVLLYLHVQNKKSMTKQIRDIIEFEQTNYKVQDLVPLKTYSELNFEINRLLENITNDRIQFNKKTKAYQEEVLNISHDLRTPLTSMKGFMDIIESKYRNGEDISEYLAIVDNKIEVLNNLVETFYEISQIESDDYLIEPEFLNLNELISDTMLAFYGDFEMKKLDVEMNLSDALPDLYLDRKLVLRVITNIIQNILKYGKTHCGVKTISAENAIQLVFINDISEDLALNEDLEKIFNRSYTADSSRTKGSLGLGLVIVKKLVELQNGRISPQLEDNIFRITIEFKK